jgi:hypothetical protein
VNQYRKLIKCIAFVNVGVNDQPQPRQRYSQVSGHPYASDTWWVREEKQNISALDTNRLNPRRLNLLFMCGYYAESTLVAQNLDVVNISLNIPAPLPAFERTVGMVTQNTGWQAPF